jgi:hypothetical protein
MAAAARHEFVKDLQPSYKDHPDRLMLLEEPKTGLEIADGQKNERPIRYLVTKH